MAEHEDEDDFPNDFDGLDFDGITVLQAPTISRHTPEVSSPSVMTSESSIIPPVAASPILSTMSDGVEDMDSSFLAAVDELEARVLGEMTRGNEYPRSEPLGSRHHTDQTPGSLNHSKPDGHCPTNGQAFDSPPGGFSSATRKGKEKAKLEEDATIRTILAGYESELTCPICCDLLVGAQVANPCGHTCCGECGYQWLAQNKYEPTCAVCRTDLYNLKPLLPNFAADNLVRQHLQALAKSGRPEWQEKGYRTIEWNKRLESWRIVAAKEKAAASRQRRFQPYYTVDEYHWPENVDDDREIPIQHAMLRRRTRSRR